ncbi:hypothetical protein GS3922_16900 [Geobacillus subterraneus]|uniref:Uncharacterized protein n=2 Tax=Geobacillus TaxID=129337 RepID=A0ABM6A7M1_9BACL|nr:hypothetical protein GS3922_00040 [Geobacillus subterraneus]AMX85154.1 hypothetical protein GS3922_16900 [Geobacillus subterraneus]KZS25653.1 hypothetical protein A5418_02595 [Geobacillus subterraneus]OXB85358.1 hypothetical protein B9L21_17080 [Geobacillus uzenensis]
MKETCSKKIGVSFTACQSFVSKLLCPYTMKKKEDLVSCQIALFRRGLAFFMHRDEMGVFGLDIVCKLFLFGRDLNFGSHVDSLVDSLP